jgi:hypothetical protein
VSALSLRQSCILQEEAAKKLDLYCPERTQTRSSFEPVTSAVNALGIKDELGHKMKMFRQKSYDVLKGPSLQLLF